MAGMRRTLAYMELVAVGLLAGASLASAQIRCEDKAVAATAIETREDVRAFVRCAREYALERGFSEARRAFHAEERWKSGQFYVFVIGIPPDSPNFEAIVFPPDPAREGSFLGPAADAYGSSSYVEAARISDHFGGGWIYYSFRNPATGRDAPKASYIELVDWDGVPAYLGAGIYLPDLPGACNPEEISAGRVGAAPAPERLQELVRCAALLVAERGYFAVPELTGDPRWRAGSIYLFGLDLEGVQVFTGNPVRVNGLGMPEWGDARNPAGPFGGRDVVSVAGAFGETFLYYDAFNPASGRSQRKVSFVKRVLAQGVPLLIGSGYYLPEASAP